ncbi:MAG: TonB-dependent receptor [Rhizomicrobium sp.]|jgi:iron complex outermembrane receptor protein
MTTRTLKLALCATACMLAMPAAAQTSGSSTSSSPFAQNGQVETVTVTARRRSENQQVVPIAVTALSGSDLRVNDVKNAIDLQNLAPSLTVAGNLGERDTQVFTLRGQSQPFGGADPGVQTYFAEVPFGASGPGNQYDMQSIQVLEGPQGTLFGKSTTGGAVLFEPIKPTDQYGGYLDGELGDYDLRELQGAVNMPIVDDMLDVRVAGDWARRDGFTKDLSTGQELDNEAYNAYRIGVMFRPFAHFQNYTVFDYLHEQTNGTGAVLTGVNLVTIDELAASQGENCAVNPTICGFEQEMAQALQQQQHLGPRYTTSSIDPGFQRDTWNVVDQAQYDFSSNLYLRNIFGFISDKERPSFDIDGSFLPLLDIPNSRAWEQNNLQVSDELQLHGNMPDQGLNWVVGFYHELDHPGGYSEVERETLGGPQPFGSPFFGFGSTQIDELGNGGTSNAVYASATYDAGSWVHGLTFSAGGRYTWDHKVATDLECVLILAGTSCPFPLVSGEPNVITLPVESGNFHAPSWNLEADYHYTDESMIYASYNRGYKSGGFNSGAGSETDFEQFEPEYLTDVELGTKNNWTILGVPGITNADVYYGWYDNVQKNDTTAILDLGEPTAFAALTFNAAKATIKGAEFDSTFIPDDNFQVRVFYSYTDASYSKFLLPEYVSNYLPPSPTINLSGSPFAYTPQNKLGVQPRFHIPVDSSLGSPFVSAMVYWQSSEWFTDLGQLETTCGAFNPATEQCLAPGGQQPKQGPYWTANFRFDWDNFLGEPFDASFFVDNAFNKTYQEGANPYLHLIGTNASIYAPPRMWGIELRYRFGADGQ